MGATPALAALGVGRFRHAADGRLDLRVGWKNAPEPSAAIFPARCNYEEKVMRSMSLPAARSLLVGLCAALTSVLAVAGTRVPGPLVDTAWLAGQLPNPDVVVLDVRDDPANFERQLTDRERADPRGAPLVGHVPGARLLDWKFVRETREIDGVKLDKMLITADVKGKGHIPGSRMLARKWEVK